MNNTTNVENSMKKFFKKRPRKHLLSVFTVCISLASKLYAASPQSRDEVLQCMIFVTTYSADGKPLGNGSGFVVDDGETQWIYTNAHVIAGASKIEFTDLKGARLTSFGRFQCYSIETGAVQLGDKKYGGDGVRIELKERRSMALEISTDPKHCEPKAKVITFGDNDGDKKFEVMDGVVVDSRPSVILTTCKTRAGCSGGALIDPELFQVIGLHTYGVSVKVKLSDVIWQNGVDVQVAGASILSQSKWLDYKVSDFLKGSEEAEKFKHTVRMMSFIYRLIPQEDGFKLNPTLKIAHNVTVKQAFEKFAQDPILKPIIEMNRDLGGKSGKIGINKMDMVRRYSNALSSIRDSYTLQRNETTKCLAPYYQIKFQLFGFYELGDSCHKNLEDAQKWFQKKSEVGGAMPVGKWFNLTPIDQIGK